MVYIIVDSSLYLISQMVYTMYFIFCVSLPQKAYYIPIESSLALSWSFELMIIKPWRQIIISYSEKNCKHRRELNWFFFPNKNSLFLLGKEPIQLPPMFAIWLIAEPLNLAKIYLQKTINHKLVVQWKMALADRLTSPSWYRSKQIFKLKSSV